ncbi:TniQ family protein [Vibrio parahaemolyticus]|uniref:TniQ family protein n=1 Tax=Vibrio parahaemolyticus TaxID=670 RepID=UPI0038912308
MTAMNTELPLRPRPQKNETLLGYILRVTHVNGYRQEQTVRKLFGLKSTPFHYITSSYRGFDDLAEMMSVRLRISPENIKEHFEHELDDTYDDARAVQDISVMQPKVCLGCLAEERPISAGWRLAHITHCEHHFTPLKMHCPACKAELKWKPILYSCCDSCGIKWKDLEIQGENIPLYQSVEKELTEKQLKDYRRLLYKMTRLSLRFYDMQKCEFRTFPSDVDDVYSLFDFSYRLLVDRTFRELQLQRRVNFWRKSANLHYLPNSFFDILHDEYRHSVSFLSDEVDSLERPCHLARFQSHRIANPRKSLIRNSTDVHVQLGITALAKCMALTTADISSMVKQSLLPTQNETRLPRDYWFNAEDINELYQQIRKNSKPVQDCQTPHNLIAVNLAVSILRRYKLTIADVIKLIVDRCCDAFSETECAPQNLLSLYIDREQLFAGVDKLFSADSNEINERSISRYFFVQPDYLHDFLSFVRESREEPNDAKQTIAHDIRHFMNNYIVLNQWCKLRKLPIPKTLAHLTDTGFTPSFFVKSNHGFYVFERTEKIKRTLSEFTENNSIHQ